MEQPVQKAKQELTVTIALIAWVIFLPLIVWVSRPHLPTLCLLAIPIVFSILITLVPDI